MADKLLLDKIIVELRNGNDAPLEKLFSYYYPRLYNFSKSFLKIEDGIDDILQEVFVKIWQNRKKIKSAATFNSYIFTITRNLLLNELRKRLSNQNLKEEIQKLSVGSEYSVLKQVEYHELQEKMNNIINELPNRQKEIFILSRAEGLSHKEIADKLGIKIKTVEYHLALAVRTLKKELKALGLMSLLYFYLFF